MNVITRVHLSVDAATPETYRRVRGGDYATLRRNVDAFLGLREKRGGRGPIFRVSFIVMDENRHEQDLFLEQWKDVADLVDFQMLIRYIRTHSREREDAETAG